MMTRAARIFFPPLLVLALSTMLPAVADPIAVNVTLPSGLTDSATSTEPATHAMKYVVVEDLRITNPSIERAQVFAPAQFRLRSSDRTFASVVRPRLAAIDLSTPELLAPGETRLVTVVFLVPETLTTADLELLPHWTADDGHTVDFCCFHH